MTTSNRYGIECFEENEGNAETKLNQNQDLVDAFMDAMIVSRTTSAEPGSPAEGAMYLVPTGATGTDWSGNDGKLALYNSGTGWRFVTPDKGMRIWIEDEEIGLTYDGTNWTGGTTPKTGITASTTQSQGEQPLTRDVNVVETVGTTGDVVTLPAAEPGRVVRIFNLGANTLQVFPASGDEIDSNGSNVSVDLSTTTRAAVFVAVGTSKWLSDSQSGALPT